MKDVALLTTGIRCEVLLLRKASPVGDEDGAFVAEQMVISVNVWSISRTLLKATSPMTNGRGVTVRSALA